MKKAVLFGNPKQLSYVYSREVLSSLRERLELPEEFLTKAQLLTQPSLCRETEYLFTTWGMEHFERQEIRDLFPSLKAVFYAAGSVQHFAREFLQEGIEVYSAWCANGVPVAEYTVSQIILANKGFFNRCGYFKRKGERRASSYCSRFPGNFLPTTVGLIGAGMIGSLVAKMLQQYSLRVLCFDPFLSTQRAKELKVEQVELPVLFRESNVISNHLANNSQTVGMLDYSLFSSMKENATFLNTGRGAQIVEMDLVRALKEKPDRTAVLDVTFPEPPEADHPFYKLSNVFLTPHIAGSMSYEVVRMSEYMRDECFALLDGAAVRYRVTWEMLKTMA